MQRERQIRSLQRLHNVFLQRLRKTLIYVSTDVPMNTHLSTAGFPFKLIFMEDDAANELFCSRLQ